MAAQAASGDAHKKWTQLVALAWADDGLKQRLLADPAPVLREHGIDLPAGVEVHVVEPSERELYLLLPPAPGSATELTSNELAGIAGGAEAVSFAYAKIEYEYTPQDSSGGDSGSSCWSCVMF